VLTDNQESLYTLYRSNSENVLSVQSSEFIVVLIMFAIIADSCIVNGVCYCDVLLVLSHITTTTYISTFNHRMV